MMAFLLLVTWLGYAQPPSHYQVEFSSNEACEAARLQLIKDAERIGQAMIDRATAQDRQIGSGNKTSLLMAAISKCALRLSRLCSNERKLDGMWPKTLAAGGSASDARRRAMKSMPRSNV
jgi:hypothetical protein